MLSDGQIQPGQLIGGTYRLVRCVGRGGMGAVYEATHARLSGRYAIKFILRELVQDAELFSRFRREAEVTSGLRHPNIVQVLDFSEMEDGTPYMVMEYLDGHDLAAELGAGPMALPRAVDLIEQVASGLLAAHAQGIVHRDLKPGNIYLVDLPGSGRQLAKLVDFGISKVRAASVRLTRTATLMGTPQYMAPEQALGQPDRIEAHTDQFSLGVIAYELLAGRPPFMGDGLAAMVYQIVHEPPPPLGLGPELEAVVGRALSKRPEARFADVMQFARAFAQAAGAARPITGRQQGAWRATMTIPTPFPTPELGLDRPQTLSPRPPVTANLTYPVRPPSRTKLWALGLAMAGAAGVGAALFLSKSPPPPVAPPPAATRRTEVEPPPAPTEVTIAVHDGPSDLEAVVDGELEDLPLRWPRGEKIRTVLFRAPGFEPKEIKLDATKDRTLVLTLQKAPAKDPKREPSHRAAPSARRPRDEAKPAAPAPNPPRKFNPILDL